MYQELTKYIPIMDQGTYGQWQTDTQNSGSPEHPIHLPYVQYSEEIHRFIRDVHRFADDYPEADLCGYVGILRRNGIEWSRDAMSSAEVSRLDGTCVAALILGVIRADRFSEGTLLDFCNNGRMTRWLYRLWELDETEHENRRNEDVK